jgi:regulatory protein YycH of two-component signal transduction system YycFG
MKKKLKMIEDVMKMMEDVMKMMENVMKITKQQTFLLHPGRKQDSALLLNRTPIQINSHAQFIRMCS